MNKWWSTTKFLHTGQIFENLRLLLFFGGVVHEVCVKWPSEGHQGRNLSVNVVSDIYTKWWPR